MQLTGELAPLGYAHRETEFIVAPSGPVAGQRIYGACGPTALASCASAALQKLVTTEQVYTLMDGRNLCNAQGVSNDNELASASAGLGLSIDEHHSYSGDVWAGWQTFLGWHLGSRDHPTLLELAHGQNLHDEASGLGENASGLTYHFIGLIKRHAGGYSAYAGKTLPSGYWACDGDNYAGGNNRTNGFHAADALQFYSDATLTAAMPCAGIAFVRTGGGNVAGVPNGWHDDGTTLTASNGVKVIGGIRLWVLAHTWDANDTPMADEFYPSEVELGNPSLGAGAVQFFKISGQLSWTQARNVFQTWNGHEMAALHAALASAQAATKSAQDAASAAQAAEASDHAHVSDLQAQVTQLQAQLAAAQQQPPAPPQPAPAPLTPQQQNDLAAMAAIRAALA